MTMQAESTLQLVEEEEMLVDQHQQHQCIVLQVQ